MMTVFAPRVPMRDDAKKKKDGKKEGNEGKRGGGSSNGRVRAPFSHYLKFFRRRWLA